MYERLRQFQAEKRSIKADPVEYSLKMQAIKQQKERDEKLEIGLRSNKIMTDIVMDIEEVSLLLFDIDLVKSICVSLALLILQLCSSHCCVAFNFSRSHLLFYLY